MRRRGILAFIPALFGAAGCTQTRSTPSYGRTNVSTKLYLTRGVLSPTLKVTEFHPYAFTKVAQLNIRLNAGDTVDLAGSVEDTNDLGDDVMFARFLKESPSGEVGLDDGSWGILPGDTMICRPMGQNTTPDMHHGMLYVSGFFQATETREHKFVFVAYAALSIDHPSPTVDISYVELHAKVTPNVVTDDGHHHDRIEALEGQHPIHTWDSGEFG